MTRWLFDTEAEAKTEANRLTNMLGGHFEPQVVTHRTSSFASYARVFMGPETRRSELTVRGDFTGSRLGVPHYCAQLAVATTPVRVAYGDTPATAVVALLGALQGQRAALEEAIAFVTENVTG